MKIKVGSLFDGIGGAPLSAVLSGAEPVWASEIEKIPISITKRHFPNMKHYGDITQINGAEIEPVDIIVGGSPCQDLSVAGKRAGLEGARSGLFMDQVRIVKEMRNATSKQTGNGSDKLPRPRYMVWENVPGAFSSNKGEDFRAVLEETARVADPTISIPRSVNGWANAGSILADGFTISWRTFDAQYWGVPQRRRRIYLVADFGGHTAPEILFEQESVSGDIAEGGETGQRIAADAERSSGATGELVLFEPGIQCLRAEGENRPSRPSNIIVSGFSYKASSHAGTIGIEQEKAPTLLGARHDAAIYYQHNPAHGDNQAAVAYSLQGNMIGRADHNGPQGSGVNEDVSFTLKTVDRHAVCYDGSTVTSPTNAQNPKPGDPCHTLGTKADEITGMAGNTIAATLDVAYATELGLENQYVNAGCPNFIRQPVYSLDRACFNQGINAKYGISIEENTAQTLVARGPHAVVSPEQKYLVRRLTPLECERLQGYPDGWTALDHEDKAVSDTQRYKALGNSFAVPNALFVISRCVKQLQKEQVNEKD